MGAIRSAWQKRWLLSIHAISTWPAACAGPACVHHALARPGTLHICTFNSMDSSDKDQLSMEPNSKDQKDNDQEAEDTLSISISLRLIQLAAPRMTSVNSLGTSIMHDCLWRRGWYGEMGFCWGRGGAIIV